MSALPSTQPAWQKLTDHVKEISGKSIPALFEQDAGRFEALSFSLPGMLVDFSKNHVSYDTLSLLCTLAEDCGLPARIQDMLTGEKINVTENRAVLHTALRAPKDAVIEVDGKNVVPDIRDVLERMERCAEDIRSGTWRGHSGEVITDVVNIGIGGSYLGPELATEALSRYAHERLNIHYVANVEASDLHRTLHGLNMETTLFVIASKTFTTAETMQNARNAREKLIHHYRDDESAVAKHFIALSTNADAVKDFGIAEDNMFGFWDWVGGRYSVWSAIGFSTMVAIGAERFRDFLNGAQMMDDHFKTAPLDKNIPVLMALIGIWYRNFMHYPAYAAIPYHSALGRLAAWLQQADMESNGKHVDLEGNTTSTATGPIVFGESGTDAQHSFFQWLHQSPDIVPVDFIAAVKTPYGTQAQQNILLANCLAQSEALMNGQTIDGQPQRHFSGSRPSTTILLDELTPQTLGMLMALYEHKIFVQGVIWGINSFDQFGVELGKVLAKTIQSELESEEAGQHDGSTTGLMNRIKSLK